MVAIAAPVSVAAINTTAPKRLVIRATGSILLLLFKELNLDACYFSSKDGAVNCFTRALENFSIPQVAAAGRGHRADWL